MTHESVKGKLALKMNLRPKEMRTPERRGKSLIVVGW